MSENDRRFNAIVNAFTRLDLELDALERRRSTEGVDAKNVIDKMRESIRSEREILERAFRVTHH